MDGFEIQSRLFYYVDKNVYGGIKEVSPCFYRLTDSYKKNPALYSGVFCP